MFETRIVGLFETHVKPKCAKARLVLSSNKVEAIIVHRKQQHSGSSYFLRLSKQKIIRRTWYFRREDQVKNRRTQRWANSRPGKKTLVYINPIISRALRSALGISITRVISQMFTKVNRFRPFESNLNRLKSFRKLAHTLQRHLTTFIDAGLRQIFRTLYFSVIKPLNIRGWNG